MTNPLLIQKCKKLRKKGFTLGEIMRATKLPKTTIYYNICNLAISKKIEKRIKDKSLKKVIAANQKRKGKCWPGREITKPNYWSSDLLFLTAHFIFDGEIGRGGCIYQNRSLALINLVKQSMKKLFSLEPYYKFYQENGVHRISYHNVELASYFREKTQQLKSYLNNSSLLEKRIFIRAFFDDEGCAYWWKNSRKVRGYQHDLEILKLIQKLLKDFNIKSKIEEKGKEVVISSKENIIKFRDKINFSKGIFINPNRKNSIWKQKLEKREILNKLISSYQI